VPSRRAHEAPCQDGAVLADLELEDDRSLDVVLHGQLRVVHVELAQRQLSGILERAGSGAGGDPLGAVVGRRLEEGGGEPVALLPGGRDLEAFVPSARASSRSRARLRAELLYWSDPGTFPCLSRSSVRDPTYSRAGSTYGETKTSNWRRSAEYWGETLGAGSHVRRSSSKRARRVISSWLSRSVFAAGTPSSFPGEAAWPGDDLGSGFKIGRAWCRMLATLSRSLQVRGAVRVRFGDFVLDRDALEVTREGRRVGPGAFPLLDALVSGRTRAHSRAELDDRLRQLPLTGRGELVDGDVIEIGGARLAFRSRCGPGSTVTGSG
jgi:hypothetical protein